MSSPRVSVVIPTCSRPRLLREAIDSALDNTPGAVEVIVVPNGPDESWKGAAEHYSEDPRVTFSPIRSAHANKARNHGMSLANGVFLRFLDDDDLVRPGAHELQCQMLEDTGAEICSGSIELIDESGFAFRSWDQPPTDDFVESVLMPGRVTANLAHVFRRDSISGHTWDEEVSLGQDTHWMHSLCRSREWKWVHTQEVVGQWRHHSGPRISSSERISWHLRLSAQMLLDTVACLENDNRLSVKRRASAVAGLWRIAHSGFFLAPFHWWRVIRAIRKIGPGSVPDVALFRSWFGRLVDPVLLEAAMVPKRWVNHWLRRWNFKRGRLSQVLPP